MYTREEAYEECLKYFNGEELPATSCVNKYLLKTIKNDEEIFLEKHPDQMFMRLAIEFARKDHDYDPLIKIEKRAQTIFEIFQGFQRVVPQGSVLYGLGNPKPVMLSNCTVIQQPEDSISGIFKNLTNVAHLSKRRCGVGIDLSTLRPEFATVNNAANSSSGAYSFADLYSAVIRKIGQDGRRGALLISMHCKHPDIIKFISCKKDSTKVTGANISVMISDEFVHCVLEDKEWKMQWPLNVPFEDAQYTNVLPARTIWDHIAKNAHFSGDPGLLFEDRSKKFSPAYNYLRHRVLTTNPCGEQGLSAEDSCRLISQNLMSYVENPYTAQAYFDFEKYREDCAIKTRLGDNLVDLEIEKIDQIISKFSSPDEIELLQKFRDKATGARRIGLGTHGLADVLIALGIKYDSSEAISCADKIFREQKEACYRESIRLAKVRGPFPDFSWEKEKDNEFIRSLPKDIQEDIKKYGRRNLVLLTNAPTGTLSICSQTSSGIEPVFSFWYNRKRKLDINETITPDEVDETGERWVYYKVFHKGLKDWMDVNNGNVEDLPEFFVSAPEIDSSLRIDMQSVIQQHVDNSISSTLNLHKEATPQQIKDIYFESWKKGLKGVTVYRDGSKGNVLFTDEGKFAPQDSIKRPEVLNCDIHHLSIKGEKYTLFVGLLDEHPYEIMGGKSHYIDLPKSLTSGKIKKRTFKTVNAKYDLECELGGENIYIKDINKVFDNVDNEVLTRLISLSLRHKTSPKHVVQQLQKDPDSSFVTFAKSISRVLKKYIQDGEQSNTKVCMECGAENTVIYTDGCEMCTNCGWSKCG